MASLHASVIKSKLWNYEDELKSVFKYTPTQVQTIIFASSDIPNVGDSVGGLTHSRV